MKRIYALLTIALVSTIMFAQSPQKMSCQAVIRNNLDQKRLMKRRICP